MRKVIIILVIVLCALSCVPLFAAEKGKKGASSKAYEHASEQAIFNRVSDWFATIGKSKEEKEAIITQRKTKRAQKRAEKELRKQERIAERKVKLEERQAEKKVRAQERTVERKMREIQTRTRIEQQTGTKKGFKKPRY